VWRRSCAQVIMYRTMKDLIMPKLVYLDLPLFMALLSDLFPGVELPPAAATRLTETLELELREHNMQVRRRRQPFRGEGFRFQPVESNRASLPHRPREDGLTHPADTSRSNLAAALGRRPTFEAPNFNTVAWYR
jgi:hypothetical protein